MYTVSFKNLLEKKQLIFEIRHEYSGTENFCKSHYCVLIMIPSKSHYYHIAIYIGYGMDEDTKEP